MTKRTNKTKQNKKLSSSTVFNANSFFLTNIKCLFIYHIVVVLAVVVIDIVINIMVVVVVLGKKEILIEFSFFYDKKQ